MILKRKNICYLRVYAVKAGEGNDNNQDYIQIMKRYMVKFGCSIYFQWVVNYLTSVYKPRGGGTISHFPKHRTARPPSLPPILYTPKIISKICLFSNYDKKLKVNYMTKL